MSHQIQLKIQLGVISTRGRPKFELLFVFKDLPDSVQSAFIAPFMCLHD